MIPYGAQAIDQSDIDAVVQVLQGRFLTQGPAVAEFEQAIGKQAGCRYVVAVSNGTSALHLACCVLDLEPGDIFWTTPNTFVASASCGLFRGAQVDFVDIHPDSRNMDIHCLEEKLRQAKRLNKLPKCVIPVHFAGLPCELDRIQALSKEFGFKIIEDAAHALGARYRNSSIGNCQYSDITTFSFHPVKMVTTGEGGAICTNDETLYRRLLRLRQHGIEKPVFDGRHPNTLHAYQQVEVGYNYRLTDIQAALGTSQMKKVGLFLKSRQEKAAYYYEQLKHLPLKLPKTGAHMKSSWHLFVIELETDIETDRIKTDKVDSDRDALAVFLKERGIGTQVHYIPVYWHPSIARQGFKPGYCPNSEAYYKRALSLPLYPGLSQEEQDYIIQSLKEYFS